MHENEHLKKGSLQLYIVSEKRFSAYSDAKKPAMGQVNLIGRLYGLRQEDRQTPHRPEYPDNPF